MELVTPFFKDQQVNHSIHMNMAVLMATAAEMVEWLKKGIAIYIENLDILHGIAGISFSRFKKISFIKILLEKYVQGQLKQINPRYCYQMNLYSLS
jgi:hypothetical protein